MPRLKCVSALVSIKSHIAALLAAATIHAAIARSGE
jgi:hypothetical protein